jgi:sec-independent protein translocase protein TatB
VRGGGGASAGSLADARVRAGARKGTGTLPRMFNVGGGELIVIALIALIVLGPQRLPGAARQVGKAVGDLRRLSSGFQNELRAAFDDAERQGPPPSATPMASAIDAVSAQAEPAPSANGQRPATKTASAKKGAAKKGTAKKPAPKRSTAKKPAAAKAPATKATSKRAVSGGARRRSQG